MIHKTIEAALAPCGLSCETCFAHVDGDIRAHSLKLKQALGNFDGYALRFETLLQEPAFKNYPAFKEMLDYFAAENCRGCRNETCRLFKTCGVRSCHQEKQVDFCYQCSDFPCNRTRFDEAMQQNWILLNEKIKREGLNAYYEKTRTRHRYR